MKGCLSGQNFCSVDLNSFKVRCADQNRVVGIRLVGTRRQTVFDRWCRETDRIALTVTVGFDLFDNLIWIIDIADLDCCSGNRGRIFFGGNICLKITGIRQILRSMQRT